VSRVALLDVNLLIALFDGDHVHHDLAHDWFADQRADGWATCPVTENGLIRVLSNPAYGSPVSSLSALVRALGKFTRSGRHHRWDDVVSLGDTTLFNVAAVRGHRQITDVYLLGLAHKKGGCLATFDRSIPLGAVVGATRKDLTVIAPVGETEG
jgi:toxin-antitoxin system PIN domain toxin